MKYVVGDCYYSNVRKLRRKAPIIGDLHILRIKESKNGGVYDMNRRAHPYETHDYQPIYRNPTFRPNQPHYNPYEQMQHQTPFEYYAKPNQPADWPYMAQQQSNYYPYQQPNRQPNQAPNLLTQFQTSEGQVDLQKMLSTVGQLANTVQQVSPVIKEIGAMISVFRQ